jgi:hypothetical protein
MELILAKKIEELEFNELLEVLRKFQTEDRDAFQLLQELVEDI